MMKLAQMKLALDETTVKKLLKQWSKEKLGQMREPYL